MTETSARFIKQELERRRGMQAALQAIEDERRSLAARLAAKAAKCEVWAIAAAHACLPA
jgi:hypothetical protein